DTPAPSYAPIKPKPAPQPAAPVGDGGTVFDAVLQGKQFQQLLRTAVLDALRSPEGQDLLTQAIRKELAKLK
ncbi:MAG: transcriptional regulator, partial [Oscillospiraceae bacterium]|nr:transcriptional regulator [Oscillospiraceae bacterium]